MYPEPYGGIDKGFWFHDKGFIGDVAQLGERGVRNAEVRGSSPLISTTISFHTVSFNFISL